jgi:hypothetical protein
MNRYRSAALAAVTCVAESGLPGTGASQDGTSGKNLVGITLTPH